MIKRWSKAGIMMCWFEVHHELSPLNGATPAVCMRNVVATIRVQRHMLSPGGRLFLPCCVTMWAPPRAALDYRWGGWVRPQLETLACHIDINGLRLIRGDLLPIDSRLCTMMPKANAPNETTCTFAGACHMCA